MAAGQPRRVFINLAVEDLGRSVDFFTKLGFTFDQRFTDHSATCMALSDEAYVTLLVAKRFQDFTTRQITGSTTHTEVIVAVSADRWTSWSTRRWRPAVRLPTTRWTTGSCMPGASTTPTGICGRSSGWTRTH